MKLYLRFVMIFLVNRFKICVVKVLLIRISLIQILSICKNVPDETNEIGDNEDDNYEPHYSQKINYLYLLHNFVVVVDDTFLQLIVLQHLLHPESINALDNIIHIPLVNQREDFRQTEQLRQSGELSLIRIREEHIPGDDCRKIKQELASMKGLDIGYWDFTSGI